MLPTLQAVCRTDGCSAVGRSRLVVLRSVAPGVVGAPACWCAACGERMEESVPKITRHGGASNAAAERPTADEETAPAVVDEGVASSPGSSSETSSEKPPTSSEPSDPVLPKRARTTASRSGKGRTGSSTARSTGSSTEADEAS